MIIADDAFLARLLAMPVTETRTFNVGDRDFTIIDSEFFYDLCRRAGVGVEFHERERG